MSEGAVDVLIVDDHTLVAEGVEAVLATAPDVRVVGIAATGKDALAMVAAYRPVVVLLDQRLPDVEGTEIVPEIHRLSPDTKVLLVTGGAADDLLVRAVEAGCAGFVPKGQRVRELVDAVRAVAAGDAVIEPAALARLLPALASRGRRLGSDLTARERQVLELLVRGASNADITAELVISPATTRNHVQSVIAKLGAHSKLEAVAIAMRERVVQAPW